MLEEGIEDVRLWARLTGGLSGSQEAGGFDPRSEDWEDLDPEEESLGSSDTSGDEGKPIESEREERIRKGRIARALAATRKEYERPGRSYLYACQGR